jgi:hypothetical protein
MNWRHTVGEVLLIVIGVSIALAANSWWEERKERQEERAVLEQIRETLEIDLREFEEYQRVHLEQESNIIRLLEHMEGDEPYYPELARLFRSVRLWRGTESNRAAFEALRSRGFELVSNADLRSGIIYYYEDQALRPADAARNDREFVVTRLSPYIDQHFIHADTTALVPLDYEILRRDVYFRNLCMTKLSRLQHFILPNYQQTNRMIRELISMIDTELGEGAGNER